MFGIGTLIGGALGGLAGGLLGRKPSVPALHLFRQRSKFSGPVGTATPTHFTFRQDPNKAQAVAAANQNLAGLLRKGLAIDQNRLNEFRNAFFQARAPQLEENLRRQRDALNASAGAKGLTGSSGSLLAQQLFQQAANRQRQSLLNQSILGAEGLANQALQQDLTRAGLFNRVSQEDIANKINAMAATQNAFNAQAGIDLNATRLNNQVQAALTSAQNQRDSSLLNNIIGGAVLGSTLGSGGFGSILGSAGGDAAGASLGETASQLLDAGLSPSDPEFNAILQGQAEANQIATQGSGLAGLFGSIL